jgi:hypothetical protein
MKNLNRSSMAALLAGGSIALLPLDSLTDQLIAVAIAFLLLNVASYFISRYKPAK